MAPQSLIGERVELEMELIEPFREVHRERSAIRPRRQPLLEPARQSEAEQLARARVQPVGRQIEVAGDAGTRGCERLGQRIRGHERSARDASDDVDIAGRTGDEAESDKGRAADDDQFRLFTGGRELLGQRREDAVEI